MAEEKYRRQNAYTKTEKGRAVQEAHRQRQKAARAAARAANPPNCNECGATFCGKQNERYCSSGCRAKARSAQSAKQRAAKRTEFRANCANCGGVFSSVDAYAGNRKYCGERCFMAQRLRAKKAREESAEYKAAQAAYRKTARYKSREAERRNRPEAKAKTAAYRKTAASRAVQSASHAKRRMVEAVGEKFDPLAIFERDGWRCQICGVSTPLSRRGTRHANAPELDHVVPLSRGGAHTVANVQCACRECNRRKSGYRAIGQVGLFTDLVESSPVVPRRRSANGAEEGSR
jgi:5-methylcytosine-specific restriction endonuclease McrA